MSVKISTCILLVSLFLGLHPITTSSRCPDSQKSLLLSFENDLTFDSKGSTGLVGWDESVDCCEWWGVRCDAAGHLLELYLAERGISGGINASHLRSFNSLQILNFDSNSLSNFPESLLTLPSLQDLSLGNNKLSGHIRQNIHVTSYNLSSLSLHNNSLQGPLPEFIFKLPSLSSIVLSRNHFTGIVHLDVFGKFKNLQVLSLSYNNLTVIANTNELSVAKLDVLWLASCKMLKIPNLKNQASLRTLDLSDNRLKGEIPNRIWNVGKGSLVFLSLSKNKFSSLEKPYTFPSSIKILDLSSNMLKGDIPVPPSEVVTVNYSNNKFGSSIPADFGNALNSMESFLISHSKVVGVIPDSINNASSLRILDLSSNSLGGPIPLVGSRVKYLESLDLSINKLSGRIPEQLTSLMGLAFLNVSYNRLSGKIPQGGIHFPLYTNMSFVGNKGLCGPPLSKTCGTGNKWM